LLHRFIASVAQLCPCVPLYYNSLGEICHRKIGLICLRLMSCRPIIRMILMMLGGLISVVPYYCVSTPQSCDFLPKAKAPYLKVKIQPISCQNNSRCGKDGDAFSLCYTQRKFTKKMGLIHAIGWHFEHEGLVKTKIFCHICKNNIAKSFYTFLKNVISLSYIQRYSSLKLAKVM
jgi:hypothetical protein